MKKHTWRSINRIPTDRPVTVKTATGLQVRARVKYRKTRDGQPLRIFCVLESTGSRAIVARWREDPLTPWIADSFCWRTPGSIPKSHPVIVETTDGTTGRARYHSRKPRTVICSRSQDGGTVAAIAWREDPTLDLSPRRASSPDAKPQVRHTKRKWWRSVARIPLDRKIVVKTLTGLVCLAWTQNTRQREFVPASRWGPRRIACIQDNPERTQVMATAWRENTGEPIRQWRRRTNFS